MKVTLQLAALTMALLASATAVQANWWGPPITIDTGVNARFNVHVHDVSACWHLQPWYTYFPYEAHFQAVAPIGPSWPNWPQRMSSNMPKQQDEQKQAPGGQDKLPPGFVPPLPPVPPNGGGPNLSWGQYPPQSVYQPVGYYPAPVQYQVPSYWYGR